MSEPKNKDPFAPWNDPFHKNDPWAAHNDPMRANDPWAAWNDPFGTARDLNCIDRKTYGLRCEDECEREDEY